MIFLNADERDAIAEAFNMGVGVAAASLSEMVEREVTLSVPDIDIMLRDQAKASLGIQAHQQISGVIEEFKGSFEGHAMLLFPKDISLELVRLLLKQDVENEFLTEMESEALIEVGNIIINACLGSIANIMGEEINNQIPEAVTGRMGEIITDKSIAPEENYIMKLRMDFHVADEDISGYIAFIMGLDSIDKFRRKLAEYFGFEISGKG